MNTKKLPVKLGKEPLIDVVCGVNFQADAPADELLPGLISQKLFGRKLKFESMGIAQLPQAIRDQDPSLKNAPLISIKVDEQFVILIGTKWLGVGCIMPYSGWAKFKEMICTVFSVLQDGDFLKGVERYSLKYVDFIQKNEDAALACFDLIIDVAGRKILDQNTQLRVELVEHPFIHAVSLISDAMVNRPDQSAMRGSVIEVDTHRVENFSVTDFFDNLTEFLDSMHDANKRLFFDLLNENGLNTLEPKYG